MATETTKPSLDREAVRWYVMRCHNMAYKKTRASLEAKQLEYYVPETLQMVVEKGKKVKRMHPVFQDLFFVHSSYNELMGLLKVNALPLIFYFSHTSHIQNDALWIKDKEMQIFMKALSCVDNNPTVRPFGEINFKKGDYIRVVDGPAQGIEGYFVQIKRGQKKQLVIALSNLITVNLALGKDDLIDIVEREEE